MGTCKVSKGVRRRRRNFLEEKNVSASINNQMNKILSDHSFLGKSEKSGGCVTLLGNDMFVLNGDLTLFCQYSNIMVKDVGPPGIAFRFFDYDDGDTIIVRRREHVVFVRSIGNLERRKTCSVPPRFTDGEKTSKLFSDLEKKFDFGGMTVVMKNGDKVKELLSDSMSHVELFVDQGEVVLRQRDVYSGSIVEVGDAKLSLIHKDEKRSGLLDMNEMAKSGKSLTGIVDRGGKSFGPIGIWRKDLEFLCDRKKVVLRLPATPGVGFLSFSVDSNDLSFDGLLSFCLYDDLSPTIGLSGELVEAKG